MPLFLDEPHGLEVYFYAVSALLATMTAVYGTIIAQLRRQNERQQKELDELRALASKTKEKTDVAWEFQMRRATVEALKKEEPMMSPTELVEASMVPATVRLAFKPIVPQLRAFYEGLNTLDDGEIALQIEKRFGDWIVRNVCVPLFQTNGECLIFAVRLAQE